MKISKGLLDYLATANCDFPRLSFEEGEDVFVLKHGFTTLSVCDYGEVGEKNMLAFIKGMINGKMYS
jgi:hypothetical protein